MGSQGEEDNNLSLHMLNHKKYLIKIISGGQTGADRAALDAAIEIGFDYGGAIPKGRKTEDGALPLEYEKMTELKSKNYTVRTLKNVMDSDATIIFTMGHTGRGSTLTIRSAKKHNKPFLHIDLAESSDIEAKKIIKEWLNEVSPTILNVAGSRESTSQGIYARVYKIFKEVFKK